MGHADRSAESGATESDEWEPTRLRYRRRGPGGRGTVERAVSGREASVPVDSLFVRASVSHGMTQVVPAAVEELLTSEPVVAHLATCHDGRPHSAPLWYRYEDGVVELLTTGRKLANLRANPRVSLSMERDEAGIPKWMVSLQGTATVVEDEAAIRAANERLNRRYGVDDEAWAENVLVRVAVGSVAYRTY